MRREGEGCKAGPAEQERQAEAVEGISFGGSSLHKESELPLMTCGRTLARMRARHPPRQEAQ